MSEIIGERQSRGRDGRRESREKRNPSGHETPSGTIGLREVNVFATGTGKVYTQLGITERPCQRAHRAYAPDEQN